MISRALEPQEVEAAWRDAVARVLQGADPDMLTWHGVDGLPVRPFYPAADAPDPGPRRAPGPWRIVQRIDAPDRAAANAQALSDAEGGADALALVVAGAPGGRGFGVPIATADDLDEVLRGVAPDRVALRFEPGEDPLAPARLVAGGPGGRWAVTADLGVDGPGTFAALGALPAPWSELAPATARCWHALAAAGFEGRLVRADGRVWHEAGASEAQELAGVLAAGVLHLRAFEQEGIAPHAARRALSFTLAADADWALTLVKFRALRRLWAAVEAAAGLMPRPIALHAETAWRMMSARAPHTNIVRTTVAACAGVLGGADSLSVLPFTAALGLPDALARRIARNIQHVLAEEAHLWRIADPAAGAGLFEALTGDLCRRAWSLFQDIEREGGLVDSLKAGAFPDRIAAARAERQARLRDGRAILVGVTAFQSGEDPFILGTPPPAGRPPAASRRDAEPFEGAP